MKGNKKILVIAVLLLLIAVSYGTYAIYKSSVSGTASVTAAKWAIAFGDGTNTFTDTIELEFGADDCVNNPHVADGKIAPGAVCTKDIEIDASGTEVDVEYTLTADESAIEVDGDDQPENSNAFDVTLTGNDGTIMMNQQGGQIDTVTVTIEWGGEEGASYDSGDTTMGEDEAVITVPITIVAKQMIGS